MTQKVSDLRCRRSMVPAARARTTHEPGWGKGKLTLFHVDSLSVDSIINVGVSCYEVSTDGCHQKEDGVGLHSRGNRRDQL